MNSAPKSSAMNRARAGWNDAPPDWIVALAEECDRTSQPKAAERIGKSAASVNLVLGGLYPARTKKIEAAVLSELMDAAISCPELGPISAAVCRVHQAEPYSNQNPTKINLFRACRVTCPNGLAKEKS